MPRLRHATRVRGTSSCNPEEVVPEFGRVHARRDDGGRAGQVDRCRLLTAIYTPSRTAPLYVRARALGRRKENLYYTRNKNAPDGIII